MSAAARHTWHVNVGARARIGRWALGAQGFAMGVFGGTGLAWSMANPHYGAAGAPLMWLRVTPLHCGLLLVVGVLTIFASLGRSAVMFSRIAALSWFIVTVVSAVATSRHVPGPLGFDARDTVLYAALTAYNVALMAWFGFPARSAPADNSPRQFHGHRSDAIGSR
jgi:hypothetical protein